MILSNLPDDVSENDPRAPWNIADEPAVICHCGVAYTRNECDTNVESEFYQARLEGEQPDIDERTGRPIRSDIIRVNECPRCDSFDFYSPDPDAELEHMKETGEHWRAFT